MERPRDLAGRPLGVLMVHAHPDDEASKGAGTIARYSDEGVHTVLVCCTGGEAGDVLNPAVDTPAVRAHLADVRLAELRDSCAVLGYSSLHLLGYRDSGMPESADNDHPESFARAPLDEAVERLVAIVRLERPQVIVTYADDREFYPHPDHLKVHEISIPAFEAAGDPRAFPHAGPAWSPSKLYFTGWSPRRIEALHAALLARGEESPYAQWFDRELPPQEEFTTFVDVGEHLDRRRRALLAHRTQVAPDAFWFRLPDEVTREVFPWEEYRLVRSVVPATIPEDDLFAGLRFEAERPEHLHVAT